MRNIRPPRKRKPKKFRTPNKRSTTPASETYSKSESVGFNFRSTSFVSMNGANSVTDQGSGFQVIGISSRSGTKNPRWRDQCRLGSNATTSYVATIYDGDLDRTPIDLTINYRVSSKTNGSVLFYGSLSNRQFLSYPIMPVPGVPPASVVTDVHNRCIAKFIDEVTAAQSSENLTGRSIRHFKHDVHSTFHPMQGIQDKIQSYLTSLKKVSYGKLKGPSLTSAISQAYLEFKFGVEPFTEDISDIVADMVIRDRKRNPSVAVHANAHARYQQDQLESVPNGMSAFGSFQPSQKYTRTFVYSERMTGACRTGINDDGRLGVIQDNRLLPKDWAPTAFSIMPYAWMVNYFTNIREIIDAASFRYSDLVWGCQTTLKSCEVDYQNIYLKTPNVFAGSGLLTQTIQGGGGSATFTAKSFVRNPLSPASLIPEFTFSIPTKPTPWVNMMAAFGPQIVNVVSRLVKLI